MTKWLKMLGSTERKMDDAWLDTGNFGSRKPMHMKPGDRVACYATGRGSVFAVGTITSLSYPSRTDRATSERSHAVIHATATGRASGAATGSPVTTVYDFADRRSGASECSKTALQPSRPPSCRSSCEAPPANPVAPGRGRPF